ncbi:MAG: hypothetical protein HYR88_12395 [Verrucomicrobia bacterium]|nr:hypothetical protein [Verrucomicrobiota bacterium]MBI3868022.1 hypothetical protein [Verrucomicrobiota bacterium]
MAFRLSDPMESSPSPAEDPVDRWVRLLKSGAPAERQKAIRQLVRLRAELPLVPCLQHPDPLTVGLAVNGLWECWLNEKGRNARKRINIGVAHMEASEFDEAGEAFLALMGDFPDWAEAVNKQATLHYLRGQPALSLTLCDQVVRMKPHHFGAWSGLGLCAAQLNQWARVREAAQKGLDLIPSSDSSRHLLALANEKLSDD